MSYQAIHEREYYDIQGLTVELHDDLELTEPFVVVKYNPGFVFGNTNPLSDGKMQASKKLKKNYDRMRVIDMEFDWKTERVVELVIAYRKAGA